MTPVEDGRTVSDIRQPNLIGSSCYKVLRHQVLGHWQTVIGIGGRFKFPFLTATDTEFATQSFNPTNTNVYPMISQLRLQTLRAVAFPGTTMSRPDF
jgi:hypothetical protein